MKRLLVNLWCIGLSLSAGVLASVGCVEDDPKPPILQGVRGPSQVIPPDAGEDSGVAGSAMSQGGSGGSGQGGSDQSDASTGGVDAGDSGT
jgi:hypothetical protein